MGLTPIASAPSWRPSAPSWLNDLSSKPPVSETMQGTTSDDAPAPLLESDASGADAQPERISAAAPTVANAARPRRGEMVKVSSSSRAAIGRRVVRRAPTPADRQGSDGLTLHSVTRAGTFRAHCVPETL